MQAVDALTLERVSVGVGATSKKRVLELCAELLADADTDMDIKQVFEALFAREKLGGTGIGSGVAIPHARVAGLQQLHAAFLALSEPVPFEAIDGQPVDLVFAMVVPEDATEDHLQLLATLARLFRQDHLRDALRGSNTRQDVLDVFSREASREAG